jgi:hypothetical protein
MTLTILRARYLGVKISCVIDQHFIPFLNLNTNYVGRLKIYKPFIINHPDTCGINTRTRIPMVEIHLDSRLTNNKCLTPKRHVSRQR